MSAEMALQPTAIALDRVPSLLELHRTHPDKLPYLLASTSQNGQLGRWSLLLMSGGDSLCLDRLGDRSNGANNGGFLERLKAWTGQPKPDCQPLRGLPFAGGWFVYLGYELVGEIEPGLRLPACDTGLPVAWADRTPAAVIIDHLNNAAWISAESPDAAAQLSALLEDGDQSSAVPELSAFQLQAEDGSRFKAGVSRIREYILDGDVFQVNLSRSWSGRFDRPVSPVDVYASLALSNPAPFAGLARLPGGTLISSSPERLVEVDGDSIQTRPIAGTRPRGQSQDDDQALSAELIANSKERAEHIMLIDLERNDLGRVCQPGTVVVDELMVIESYAHVHHIVSNVRGRLKPGIHASDVIAAVFPGGTITGCPKVRCMEIIAELEQTGRGFYTGSMGYLGHDGHLDLNILIRSLVTDGTTLQFRTGAGIVADSEPAAELAETEAKAAGLLRALAL